MLRQRLPERRRRNVEASATGVAVTGAAAFSAQRAAVDADRTVTLAYLVLRASSVSGTSVPAAPRATRCDRSRPRSSIGSPATSQRRRRRAGRLRAPPGHRSQAPGSRRHRASPPCTGRATAAAADRRCATGCSMSSRIGSMSSLGTNMLPFDRLVAVGFLHEQRADADQPAVRGRAARTAPLRMRRRGEERLVEQVFPVAGELRGARTRAPSAIMRAPAVADDDTRRRRGRRDSRSVRAGSAPTSEPPSGRRRARAR